MKSVDHELFTGENGIQGNMMSLAPWNGRVREPCIVHVNGYRCLVYNGSIETWLSLMN